MGVLVLLVLLSTQLLNSAASITTLGHQVIDTDSQARQLLDRISLDFAQLVKRSDVDFFAKGTVAPNSVGGTMAGNDRIAFYSAVPGYYPSTSYQSPLSLVAYRMNSDSTSSSHSKLERLGKSLMWNGVSLTDTPLVFMPLTISATWPAATSSSQADTAYEVIGPQVFRFEYCYLLTSGSLSVTPPASISKIAAFVVDIATIDAQSKVLLTNTKLLHWQGNYPTTLPIWFPANCVTTGKTQLMQSRPCHALRFPVFECTNAFSISRRLLYDCFPSLSMSAVTALEMRACPVAPFLVFGWKFYFYSLSILLTHENVTP